MTKFNVGDRVRLTGEEWKDGGGPQYGDIVTVTGFDQDDDATFLWNEDPNPWVIMDKGWGAELVTAAPTYADVESVASLAAELGVPVTRVGDFTRTVEQLDAIVPDHYAFPGGVRVHHISGHLTSFGGQAVQYIARSTRLDGKNKGDRVENLKKAQRMIDLEIERLEAE